VNLVGVLPISATTLVSFTDRDAIIVRADLPTSTLEVSNPVAHNYQATLPVPLGDQIIQVPRGWSTVDVKLRGKSYRFANTHLEAYSETVRTLQVQELAASLSASPLAVVLVGDINALPDTGAYVILEDAGFVDSWTESMDGDPGYTAGQTDDLDNVPSQIDHRVDYIFHNADGYVDGVIGAGEIVGEELSDRTPAGLWPSDHAGIVLTESIARP
jgi:endonuclease/exonuclease/phosphatase family metal-dependent hydrolase